MAVRVDQLDIVEWLWHDAHIYRLKVEWSSVGEVTVYMRCGINPEEDRQPLYDLHITSPIVDIQFRSAMRVKADMMGYCATHEDLLNWDMLHPSPIIEEMRDKGVPISTSLHHHQIRGSCGSQLDIVCDEIWLEEVNPDTVVD